MTSEQQNLYNKWRMLEEACIIEVNDRLSDGSYKEPGELSLQSINQLNEIRSEVWDKIRSYISPVENFELKRNLKIDDPGFFNVL